MTLQKLRDAKTFCDLKPGIKFLCDHMERMTWGEFVAYKRTLESKALELGITLDALNLYAENYQVFGYERDPAS